MMVGNLFLSRDDMTYAPSPANQQVNQGYDNQYGGGGGDY